MLHERLPFVFADTINNVRSVFASGGASSIDLVPVVFDDQVSGDVFAQDKHSVSQRDVDMRGGVGAHIWVLVVGGARQTVQSQSDESLLQQELEQLVIGLVDHLFWNWDLPNV